MDGVGGMLLASRTARVGRTDTGPAASRTSALPPLPRSLPASPRPLPALVLKSFAAGGTPATFLTQTTRTAMADDLSEADIGLTDLSLSQSPPNPRLRAIGRIPSASGSQPSIGLGIPSSVSMMNGQLKASSSPDLAERPLPDVNDNTLTLNPRRRMSRSKTLRMPRRMHRTQLSLDGLLMGTEKVAKLRRWILSLITGKWCLGTNWIGMAEDVWFVVNFDLEVGPKITSIYPPLRLTHAEAQNMSVGYLCLRLRRGLN